jgi:hypothetical protein
MAFGWLINSGKSLVSGSKDGRLAPKMKGGRLGSQMMGGIAEQCGSWPLNKNEGHRTMDERKLHKIMARAALNTFTNNGWESANPDGRRQAIKEAEAAVTALKAAGYEFVESSTLASLGHQLKLKQDGARPFNGKL